MRIGIEQRHGCVRRPVAWGKPDMIWSGGSETQGFVYRKMAQNPFPVSNISPEDCAVRLSRSGGVEGGGSSSFRSSLKTSQSIYAPLPGC